LLNAAFADANIDIFCPYDVAGLDADTVLDAWRTHPVVVELGEWRSSACYTDPAVLYAAADRPMPAPPPGTPVVRYGPADLPALRRWTERELGRAGLDRNRTDDLLVAVNELATNTVAHTTSGGTLRIWLDTEESCLICELRDIGCIDDMIAGRRRPAADAEHGRGLWIVNQLCDLVELRSGPAGTTIRLHARRERRPAWQPDPAYW
jgi:anti-sigma regulatory factor (Ser/Thr protein kinase)